MLHSEGEDWKIRHEPAHSDLLTQMDAFINKIIMVTIVIPRVEGIWRADRQKAVDEKMIEETQADKMSGGGAFAGRGNVKGDNYANMTEEEKTEHYVKKYTLPRRYQPSSSDYVAKVKKDADPIKATLLDIVQRIKAPMDEDCKTW